MITVVDGARNSSETVGEEVPHIHTLTQEAVNEQIRGFIAPLTRQLDELTWLVQAMVTTRHPSHYPRAYQSTISGVQPHIRPTAKVHSLVFSFIVPFY